MLPLFSTGNRELSTCGAMFVRAGSWVKPHMWGEGMYKGVGILVWMTTVRVWKTEPVTWRRCTASGVG
jgi:hypothetical protein